MGTFSIAVVIPLPARPRPFLWQCLVTAAKTARCPLFSVVTVSAGEGGGHTAEDTISQPSSPADVVRCLSESNCNSHLLSHLPEE